MNKTNKIVTIFLWVIIAISAVLVISFATNLSEDDTNPKMLSWLGTNLYWTYILMAISAVILVGFALFQMLTDFTAAKKGLISIGFLGIVALVAYLFSSGEMPSFLGVQKFIDEGTLTPKVSKYIDMGLISTYIMLALSFIAIIYSSVSRLFK